MKRVDLGPSLHTALRKCCDSSITTIAYLVIHAMDASWLLICDAIWQELLCAPEGALARAKHMHEWSRDEGETLHYGSLVPLDQRQRILADHRREEALLSALEVTLRTFSEGDWVGMLAYVDDGLESE